MERTKYVHKLSLKGGARDGKLTNLWPPQYRALFGGSPQRAIPGKLLIFYYYYYYYYSTLIYITSLFILLLAYVKLGYDRVWFRIHIRDSSHRTRLNDPVLPDNFDWLIHHPSIRVWWSPLIYSFNRKQYCSIFFKQESGHVVLAGTD